MRTLLLAQATLAVLVANAAQAQDAAQPTAWLDGVYSSEAGCASGHRMDVDEGVTYLTADGLEAIEYLCEFLSVDAVSWERAFVATAVCSAPGELTPELILVRAMSANDPPDRVTVLYHGEFDPTVFHRCPAE